MPSAALDFLAAVLPETGWSTLVAIHPEKKAKPVGFGVNRATLADAEPWLAAHAEWNLYWTPNEVNRRLDKKPEKDDISAFRWIHLDCDDLSDEALRRIRSYHLPPTIVMCSGGGYQAFWRIATVARVNGNAEHLEAANKRVRDDLGGDKSTWNLDRIMRLPGTRNWLSPEKRAKGRVPADAYLIEHHPDRTYTLDQFDAVPAPAPVAPRDESESGKLYRAICKVVAGDNEVTDADLLEKFHKHAHVAKMSDADRERAILRCAIKARSHTEQVATEALAEMNGLHAVVNWKGRTLILSEPRDPDSGGLELELATPREKRGWYENAPYVKGKNRFDWWFKQPTRRQYKGVVFAPQRDVPGYFNLWKGFGLQPRQGDCSLFTTMIRDVICCGDEDHFRYVMAWCADAVQNPDQRPGVALVLRGGEGIGKGTLFRALGAIFGDHFCHVFHSRHVVGHFNALLAYCLFLFADEAIYAGDKQAEGALQGLVTEPSLPIEYKGKDPIRVKNLIRVGMASNSTWVVPAGNGGRRYAVFDVSDARKGDFDYWNKVNRELDNGGREAWFHDLLQFDLSGIDLRKIPDTEARREQIVHSLDPIHKWWFGRLWAGAPKSDADEWPRTIVASDMYQDYVNEAGTTGRTFRAVETELGMALRKCAPGYAVKREWHAGVKQRVRVSYLPPLAECRAAFARRFHLEGWKWPGESAADAPDFNAL